MSKRGGAKQTYSYEDDYDYDDDYGYDEDGYDDEYYDAPKAVAKAAKAPVKQPVKAVSTPAPKPAAKASASAVDPAVEKELLDANLAIVRSVVGTQFTEHDIVAALRVANYNPDVAVEALFTASEAPSATPVPLTPPPLSPSTTGAVTLPKRSGPAKKIVLGGGKASPEPAGAGSPGGAASPHPASGVQTPVVASPQQFGVGMASPMPGRSNAASPNVRDGGNFPEEPKDKTLADVVDEDGKLSVSIVMAGHVDTGKSTILGHLLFDMGLYTDREVAKMEAAAKREGKQSFHFAWLLDQSEEERRRGVTIESGVQAFETDHRRVNVLDAPGHKDYVSSMITSTAAADLAIFTVSASTGEFESGLHNMTKEHLAIIRTLGVGSIVVAVNKMDSVDYSEERFQEVVSGMTKLIKSMKFKPEVVRGFCPVSGYHGVNLTPGSVGDRMPWYSGTSLVEYIDTAVPAKRMSQYPLRFVISDLNKHIATGRVEAGRIDVGQQIVAVPSGVKATIKSIDRTGFGSVKHLDAGQTGDVALHGDLLGLNAAEILCPPKSKCPQSSVFAAHIQLFPNLPHVMMPGTKVLLQIHALTIVGTVQKLEQIMDPKTGKWANKRMIKCLPADSQGIVTFRTGFPVALELADDVRSLGRFLIRMEDETVGGGFVKRVDEA